jgi:hypothetical protein
MSLDFSILDTDGAPGAQVSIGVDAHHRLVRLADGPLLARIADYYADAEFAFTELRGLVHEIETISARSADDAEVLRFLRALRLLASEATEGMRSIVVIAD